MNNEPLERTPTHDLESLIPHEEPLDEPAWREFLALLDRPASVHPRLQRLLNEPSVLEGD